MENAKPITNWDERVVQINALLRQAGATDVLFVGGFVRDWVLGVPSKDFDLEIYGLSYPQILHTLRPHFRIGQVGQSFSVLKVENEIDLTIPRREQKTGEGHKAFDVQADPHMTFAEAAARRDFTINAIGMRLDGSFCDPYGGLEDLRRGVLRATTHAFCEDPLRVLRGMQFAARFGFSMDAPTAELCAQIRPEFSTLSAERLFTEWYKWAVRGNYAARGLEVLRQTTWLACFPEIDHPADFLRRCQTCQVAAEIASLYSLKKVDRAVLLFAALLSMGNESEAETFLMTMKPPLWLVRRVMPLLRNGEKTPKTDSELRHFSEHLEPATIPMWNFLRSAIQEGRGDHRTGLLHFSDQVERAKELGIERGKPEPILWGRDLLECGVSAGKNMGVVLRAAWEAQLDGVFTTRDEALVWLAEYLQQSGR